MKFKLLQFPENDPHIERLESILRELEIADIERQYFLIDNIITGLYNYYINFPEDPYATDIATDLLKISAVVKGFYVAE